MELFEIDVKDFFKLQTPVLELVVRASVLYLVVLLLVRILPRRTGGELATMDLIFIVLIAAAAAPAFGEYKSLTGGLIVIGTLMLWNFLINLCSYYSPFIEKLVSAQRIQIVKNGKLLRRNMRREYLTEEELMEYVRKEGVDDVRNVKAAFIESDGKISIIKAR